MKCGTRGRECPATPGNVPCNPFSAWIQHGGVKAIAAWGLAIVNHVVRTHAGRLSVQQGNGDPGRFAVIITLPMQETKTPDIP